MAMIDFLQGLFFPFSVTQKRKKITDLEKYILSHKPDSLEQVEWLQKQYTNSKGNYDKLFY